MAFVTVDGTRIHYVREGAGSPPVVFLHAFPLSGRMWGPQLRPLSDRHLVVAPDFMGFGLSDTPKDPADYDMARYAAHVAGLIDEIGEGPAVVVGLSMGGYVAFSLLRRHRDKVAALVLADTRAASDNPEVLERRTNQQRQIAEQGTTEVIETLLAGLLSESTGKERPALVDSTRTLMDQPPAGFVGALEAMKNRPDATDDLPTIDVPVLVLVGEEDAPSPPEVARAMVEKLPDARLQVLPRAGHLSNLEAPEEFNRALQSFLDEL
jgi:pimeloyl-ACP methyl ester carboxylesterase